MDVLPARQMESGDLDVAVKFDRISVWFDSVSAVEEVNVTETMRGCAIAAFMTALDVAVISYYGSAIWQAWGNIASTRVGILLLAGGGSFTLMDIWARTFDIRRNRTTREKLGELQELQPTGAGLMERADV